MSISVIPVQDIPDQRFNIELGGQDCEIHLYLRYKYMYMDLTIGDNILFNGQICLNNTDIIQYNHLGFKGQLKFIDTQGDKDPYYSGFGERWFLTYVQ